MPDQLTVLVYAFLGLPLAVLVIFNLFGKRLMEKVYIPTAIGISVIQVCSAVICLILLTEYNKDAITFSQFWDYTLHEGAAYFSPDTFSFLALLCIGIVSLVAFLTALSTLPKKRFHFCNVMLVLLLGMNGLALVCDLFSLYVFMEITGLASFVLIALYRDAKGLEGAFKYLMMSSVASAFILMGLALIFLDGGSLQYDAVRTLFANWQETPNPTLIIVAFIMLISGFSIKAGVAPFHGWLPDAYQSAPAPVSVILGGIVTKMAGVYAIIRLVDDLLTETGVVGMAFMLLGIFSIVLGAISALGVRDFKRILAFSSVSQIGYIVLGVSCGSGLGFIGALLHFFNHATFKSTLFVNSAAVESRTGTTDIEQLGGLQKQMPITGTSNIIAFLSTAGIPPLAGFWSKLLIIIAVWQAHGGVVAGIALCATIFTVAYFLLLQRKVFFGPSRDALTDIKEAAFPIKLASILLTCITVGAGIAFPWILRFLQAQGWL